MAAVPYLVSEISIHAPARGATLGLVQTINFRTISIHAPARGATFRFIHNKADCNYFNPRSREGSDIVALVVA